MTVDVAIKSLDELDHADDGSYEDENADGVERVHVLGPGECLGLLGRRLRDTDVENCGYDNEEAEEDNLDEEAADYYVLADSRGVWVIRCYRRAFMSATESCLSCLSVQKTYQKGHLQQPEARKKQYHPRRKSSSPTSFE